MDADRRTHAGDTISGARLVLETVGLRHAQRWNHRWTHGIGECHSGVGTPAGAAEGVAVQADYVLVGEEAGGFLGGAMASAGDLDDDGKMDFIVGDFWWDNPETGVDTGKAMCFWERTLALPVKSPSPTPHGSSKEDGTTRGRPRLLG